MNWIKPVKVVKTKKCRYHSMVRSSSSFLPDQFKPV